MSYIVIEGDLESGVSRVVGPFLLSGDAERYSERNIAVPSFVRRYDPMAAGPGEYVVILGTMHGGVNDVWGPFRDRFEAEYWAEERGHTGHAIEKLDAP